MTDLEQTRGRQGHHPGPGLTEAPGVFALVPRIMMVGMLQHRHFKPLSDQPVQQTADELGLAGTRKPHNRKGLSHAARRSQPEGRREGAGQVKIPWETSPGSFLS